MFFLTISNANINSHAWNLQWSPYTTGSILLIIRKVKLIGKKKLVAALLEPKHKTFVIHVATFNIGSNIDDEVHFQERLK